MRFWKPTAMVFRSFPTERPSPDVRRSDFCFPVTPRYTLYKDESYKDLRYYDMPFDVDCEIPFLLQEGTCYDGETELMSFDFSQ